VQTSNYVSNVLVSFDCFVSTIFGGQPGETLSGRAGSAYLEGKLRGKIFCPMIDALMHLVGQFPTWRGHCMKAIDGDKQRATTVLDQRV
jgi:hypothetical protein